jgi:chromate reductase, NAD(P)H dehydrogenase (quinone)
MPRIIVFAGSIRPLSNNQKLANIAAARLKAHGSDVEQISLGDYPLPFVSEDHRANPPEEAKALWAKVEPHHGVFIASPEYNSGITPLLKNALDFLSLAAKRPPLRGKVIGLGCAAGGIWGGYKSLPTVRHVLEVGVGGMVIPDMATIQGGVWNDDGTLKDEASMKVIDAVCARLVAEAGRLA